MPVEGADSTTLARALTQTYSKFGSVIIIENGKVTKDDSGLVKPLAESTSTASATALASKSPGDANLEGGYSFSDGLSAAVLAATHIVCAAFCAASLIWCSLYQWGSGRAKLKSHASPM